MRTHRIFIAVVGLGVVLSAACLVQGQPVTLLDLVNGQAITVNDKIFESFQIIVADATNGAFLNIAVEMLRREQSQKEIVHRLSSDMYEETCPG